MSLACFECGHRGAFNTLIIFDKDGKFDPEKPVSHYPNFYTDCANLSKSRHIGNTYVSLCIRQNAIIKAGTMDAICHMAQFFREL